MEKCPANYAALTPIHLAERAAQVFPLRAAVIYGDTVVSWATTFRRCTLLASALRRRSIGTGDTVHTSLSLSISPCYLMYVYKYMSLCVCMYIYIYIYVCMYMCTYVCMWCGSYVFMCMHVHIYVLVYMCTHVCMWCGC